MSHSASQAAAFYRQVAATGCLYTVFDSAGYPALLKTDGRRAQPFWSSDSRIKRVQKACPAYQQFKIEKIKWADFVSRFVPSLENEKLLVGVNWSGRNATGYDLEPSEVVKNVEFYCDDSNAKK